MIKIDLMTKTEKDNLKKLREAHQFYLDNRRKSKVEYALDCFLSATELLIAMNKLSDSLKAKVL
jgi:hypothetical protein